MHIFQRKGPRRTRPWDRIEQRYKVFLNRRKGRRDNTLQLRWRDCGTSLLYLFPNNLLRLFLLLYDYFLHIYLLDFLNFHRLLFSFLPDPDFIFLCQFLLFSLYPFHISCLSFVSYSPFEPQGKIPY